LATKFFWVRFFFLGIPAMTRPPASLLSAPTWGIWLGGGLGAFSPRREEEKDCG